MDDYKRFPNRRFLVMPDERHKTPMQRLLETALVRHGEHEGIIEVNYDQQWRTAWKAEKLGFAEGEYPYRVTQKGREWLLDVQLKQLEKGA